MIVLHAHWQPPRAADDAGGLLLWAENAHGEAPARLRGRLPAVPKLRPHPYAMSPGALHAHPLLAGVGADAGEHVAQLSLPATRSGPQPSPALGHDWALDAKTKPFLAPWTIPGLRLPPDEGVTWLAGLPATEGLPRGATLGADLRYWRLAAMRLLAGLAELRVVPLVLPTPEGGAHARWLMVLDGPEDGPRRAAMHAAMPPVCRAELAADGRAPSARLLLETFTNMGADALTRRWGRAAFSEGYGGTIGERAEPHGRWLAALFAPVPSIRASAAEIDALTRSHRAWLRHLHVAGDERFRVALRLEAPAQRAQGDSKGSGGDDWRLHYLLQSREDPSLLVEAGAAWRGDAAAIAALGAADTSPAHPQERLLVALAHAGKIFAPILEGLRGAQPDGVDLDTAQAYAFLREAAPLLEGAGFAVLVPPWWNRPGSRLGVRLKLHADRPKQEGGDEGSGRSHVGFDTLVGYQWRVSLGEEELTREEFDALVALKTPLVQIRGQWVRLDPEQIEQAIHFWEVQTRDGEMALTEALRLGLGGEEEMAGLPIDEVEASGWLDDWLARFTRDEPLPALAQPSGLSATLRPYQRSGLSWLAFMMRMNLGACLADDMGLGKTIQTIALLLHEQERRGGLERPSLLVCPTSVVTNWQREIERFAPGLRVLAHQGPDRRRGEAFTEAVSEVDVLLTSYALLRRDLEDLRARPWFALVLDEAQNIKNPGAKQSRAARELEADLRIALTGTPVENRLSELWSIMHFLNPGFLASRRRFRKEFGLPIERYGDAQAAERLRSLVTPFVLRRLKTDADVIDDLPAKVETKAYCALSAEQATLYQAVVDDALAEVEASEGIQRKGLVLGMLMQLKQICNHPVQYLHQGEAERGDARAMLARSGKLQRLVELLEEILDSRERALIFTQFTEMGTLLQQVLGEILGVAPLYLHGGVPATKRDALVQAFQREGGPPLFVLSLKAGGTGLNLTGANHVLHFDRWWNPAVEDQATDRAYRIGQTRNVQVHKFVTTGTLEERIDRMIEDKRALAEAVVGSGEAWLSELSTAELRAIVRLRTEEG